MLPIIRVVLMCGDRGWSARSPIIAFLKAQPRDGQTVVISGGAPGADRIAWEEARNLGHRNVRIDAPWTAYGKRAGPVRNQWMLDLLLMFQLAFPDARTDVQAFHENIASSTGTADMLRRAHDAGVQYAIHSDVEEGL